MRAMFKKLSDFCLFAIPHVLRSISLYHAHVLDYMSMVALARWAVNCTR